MTGDLTLKDAQIYKDLLAKQFDEIGRELMISDEKTWEIFLNHEDTQKIHPNNLPIVKGILLGKSELSIQKYREELVGCIRENKFCRVIPILHSMTNGNLLPELISHSNKINAIILSTIDT